MNPRTQALVFLALVVGTSALARAADNAVNVDVERADHAYVVEGTFDVAARPEIVWQVLTDYEGIGRFVSSIRQSTIRKREVDGVLLEQHGVGRAWIVSLPMHVVLDVREHDRRMLVFRDVCGKSFTMYEGTWQLTDIGSGTRVTYRLKADPTGAQAPIVAGRAIRSSVKKLLDEVRSEMLARAGR